MKRKQSFIAHLACHHIDKHGNNANACSQKTVCKEFDQNHFSLHWNILVIDFILLFATDQYDFYMRLTKNSLVDHIFFIIFKIYKTSHIRFVLGLNNGVFWSFIIRVHPFNSVNQLLFRFFPITIICWTKECIFC